MEPLISNLISYKELLAFLKEKKKDVNWFNTLRTRHKFIHKPIIKPSHMLSLKEMDAIGKQGRAVFYLTDLKPYLEEIIRLHDQEDFTYKQIQGKILDRTKKLERLREIHLLDDIRLKQVEFFYDFEIAKAKIKEYLGWNDNSKELSLLDHIYETRSKYGKKYHFLTIEVKNSIKERLHPKHEGLIKEREEIGKNIDYCNYIMDSTIRYCAKLIKEKKITIKESEMEEVRANVDKNLE
ncbi:MAG: hypothetical protein KJ706_00525 [Candidatus Omnitrophica bacterium]|nr:hypothetical protein [Candidatus Omnitrophota bacterium]MCG2705339.1 hypothetical protein [Candidatus Omnitrophota bacterium]